MLARFRVLLPYEISVDSGAAFPPEEIDRDGCRYRIFPPYQSAVSLVAMHDARVPISDVVRALLPANPPLLDESTTLDGRPTIQANALQIDASKPEFDRRSRASVEGASADDPPVGLLFELANAILYRLRSVGHAPSLHPLDMQSSFWRVEYLEDDGTPFPPVVGIMRAHSGGGRSFRVTSLTESIWRESTRLPLSFRPKPWEIVLLDAEAQLPDVVPAVVLAAASLEVLIGAALAELAPSQPVSAELWAFINDRGDYRKEPSVTEQFDVLLRALTGHSLKDDRPELWKAFQNLRGARNSMMHEGEMMIGKALVSRDDAFRLVASAKEIADWVEAHLPPQARRPPVLTDVTLTVARMFLTNPSGSGVTMRVD